MLSSDVAIKVEHLSKVYLIYDQPSSRLKQFIYPRLQKLAGKPIKKYFSEFWALRDVSFDIKKGETVGIIGRNGSGKSTLLQLICGTLTPSQGSIQTSGRVAALLELGSGFNPEFTGRENIYMNGAILGLSNEEITTRFQSIVEFAEIGDFIERPVKTYSSGMMVRLAFSVAINVDPQILIVDEALSVGDELFQRKCFSRIEEIRKNGSTILFVSHSGSAIVELCDSAILIDAGEKLAMGIPKQIVGRYQKLLYAPLDKQPAIREQILRTNVVLPLAAQPSEAVLRPEHNVTQGSHVQQEEMFDPQLKPTSTIEYESHGVYIENPMILTMEGMQVNNLIRGRTYRYTYRVRFEKGASNVRFGMLLKTISGIELGGGTSALSSQDSIPYVGSGAMYSVEFRFTCALLYGVYFLNAGVMGDINGTEGFLHRLVDIAMFRVMPDSTGFLTGLVDFGCFPEIERISSTENQR